MAYGWRVNYPTAVGVSPAGDSSNLCKLRGSITWTEPRRQNA
jgi:hypothetical protein